MINTAPIATPITAQMPLFCLRAAPVNNTEVGRTLEAALLPVLVLVVLSPSDADVPYVDVALPEG